MPFSIRKASKLLHEQFVKFMDVRDLDEKTEMNIGYMYADKNESSSDEASYDDEAGSDNADENNQGSRLLVSKINSKNKMTNIDTTTFDTGSVSSIEKVVSTIEEAPFDQIRAFMLAEKQKSTTRTFVERVKSGMINLQ